MNEHLSERPSEIQETGRVNTVARVLKLLLRREMLQLRYKS